MKQPIPYNPCSDGFPAKAWECLRRNKTFRKRVVRLKRAKAEKRASDAVLILSSLIHHVRTPSARVAFSYLFPLDIGKNKILRARLSVDTPWLETSKAFRAQFTSVSIPANTGEKIDQWVTPPPIVYVLPKQIQPPPKGILGRLTSEGGRNELAVWLNQWELVLKRGAWSIPRNILDPKHRKAVLTELNKVTPRAELSADPDTKRGSSHLGTKADWDTWLLISYLREHHPQLKAEHLAAWSRFEADTYPTRWEEWQATHKLAKSHAEDAKSIYDRYGKRIEKSQAAVDLAIKCMYP